MTSTVPCPSCGAEIQPDADRCDQCGTDLAKAAADIAALTADVSATLTPRFQSVRLLGQGGMGLVYLARDPGLKRDVAVKVLAPEAAADANAHKRFIREAQAAAAVAHPNVVAIHQVGELQASGAPYFVMQYVEGRTLEQEFPRGTPAAEPTARRIVAEIAAALAAAHARDVVHRDIKPSNVMLDPQSGRAIVVDFGISAAAVRTPGATNTRLTAQGISLGTPRYMSPEQAEGGELDGKTDVYSLGLIAFELLTGRPVFETKGAMALIAAHINTPPPRLAELRPEIDPAFADIVQRCLEKHPDGRPTAQDIVQLLQPMQARIEWPPPGLERLHRKGLELMRVARVQAVIAIATSSRR
jgi:serine/threonine protein kinase